MLLSVSPPLTLLPTPVAIVSKEIRPQPGEGSLPPTLPTPSALPRDIPRPHSAQPVSFPLPGWCPSCPSGHHSVHPSLYSTHSFLLDTALKAQDAKKM